MKISIFGLGYVGCVSLGCLANNGHEVVGVDVSDIKVNQINNGLPTIIEKDIDTIIKEQHLAKRIRATTNFTEAILATELSIIAVGTPSSVTGHLNLNFIYKVAENIGQAIKEKDDFHVVAIRSTVMPGTSEKVAQIIADFSGKVHGEHFAVLSNPEFLREGSAVKDYQNPPLTLIGSNFPEAAKKLASLYEALPAEIVITETKVAEIMKYVNNTFHALKISFANEVGNICNAISIDPHEVMSIFGKDKELNISEYYFKPGFAYGGSCLPKDLKGLQTLAHDLYVKAPIIESIDKTNDLQIQRAVNLIISQKKQRLGFLGLSFKAGTDDLRNSPAVTVIETLLGKGYDIGIYDRNVQVSRLTGTNKEYIDAHIPHLSKLLAPELSDILDNYDVIIINTKEKEYAEALANWKGNAVIIDFVNMDSRVKAHSNYKGINW